MHLSTHVSNRWRMWRRLVAAIGLASAWAASAAVQSVTVTSGTGQVAVGQPATVQLIWQVVRDDSSCGASVASARAEVLVPINNGTTLMTLPRPLSQTRPCPQVPGTSLFTFAESLLIPADVMHRAQKLGATTLTISRSFDDGNGMNTGEAALLLVSPAAAGLSIFREALQFEGHGGARIARKGEAVVAAVEIDYNGSGLLQGYWEIADPTTTAGEPLFRVLSQVRDYLPPADDKKVIRSPVLPSALGGLHFVRFRVTDPAPGFEAPVIRYFIVEASAANAPAPATIAAASPPAQALLAKETRFAWEAVTGAKAYRLDIYRYARDPAANLPELGATVESSRGDGPTLPADEPLTGMLFPAKQIQSTLSPAVRMHLQPGGLYLWRVRAIGADGSIIAESAPRELRTP